MTALAIVRKIGNVEQWIEIDAVIYSLAADAVVRVNDADTGEIVHRVQYPSHERALDAFIETTDAALRVAGIETSTVQGETR